MLEYRDQGYLPQAMFNFLALLGWSPGDDREKMSRDELIAAFDLDGVGRSGAVFDLEKLDWLNGQYLNDLAGAAIVPLVRARLEAAELWRESFEGEESALLEGMQERRSLSASRLFRWMSRSWCSPRRTRSSRRGRTLCPKRRWTGSC